MDINLTSEQVVVFPSVKRANGNSTYNSSRQLSEDNLVKFITSICDKECFVINYTNSGSGLYQFDVVLGGYYFHLNNVQTTSNQPLYASIKVNQSGSLSGQPELDGQDDGTYYTGITFSDSVPSSSSGYSFTLCIFDGSVVPDESLFKFVSKSVENIDDGEI